MATVMYPPEWETIINNEPITAEEFLELYRPAREYLTWQNELVLHISEKDAPMFACGVDALEYFVDCMIPCCPEIKTMHPRVALLFECHTSANALTFEAWKLVYELIKFIVENDCCTALSVYPTGDAEAV